MQSRRGGARPWRTLLAITGGLLLVLAFPGFDLVGLAVLGPAALAFAVHGQRVRSGLWLGLVVAALAVPLAGMLAWLPLAGSSRTAGGPTSTVAVIQGDVPRAVLDSHVQRTLELAEAVAPGAEPQPDAVIWPENSSDIDPYTNADAARQIDWAAAAIGAPILAGAVVEGPGEFISNTAIVWDPADGPGDAYVKRHPVPLAEYVPARDFFRLFSTYIDRVTDQRAGDEVGVLDVGGVRLGDLIFFEVVYDGLVDDIVDGGAGMIVVQTNNAEFGYTDESAQQLTMSRLRAVEFGRTVAVAATSGISAIVAPDGSIAESSDLFTPDVFVESIAQRSSSTVAQRLGAVPEWTVTAVGVAAPMAAAWPGVRARRQRRADR